MKHCVRGYYTKDNSLVLSASVDGKKMETIEFDLESMRIIQARGKCNHASKYNKEIRELINENIPKIIRAKAS